MKPLRMLLVALLLARLALPALAGVPDWKSETPLDLNGLTLLTRESEVVKKLGPPQRQLDDQLRLYGDNALVRIRDGKVVNLSVSDARGAWKLGQGGRELARTGAPEAELRASFGAPESVYARTDKPLRVLLYPSIQADLGVMLLNSQVVGFMLAEPGVMAGSLTDSGYLLETP